MSKGKARSAYEKDWFLSSDKAFGKEPTSIRFLMSSHVSFFPYALTLSRKEEPSTEYVDYNRPKYGSVEYEHNYTSWLSESLPKAYHETGWKLGKTFKKVL